MSPLTEEEQAKARIAGQRIVAAVIGAVMACPPLFLGLYQKATGVGIDGGQLLLALPGLPGVMICDVLFGASSLRGMFEICAFLINWALYGVIVYVAIKVWEAL